ncbi:uncharacterized protein PGTG_15608 [Puccinia graminis f. sp. tritici CRL 75-36-700-3]|uniref:Uncharacterized protein n=1 Tax=Puccinia graminis f. sp. tritici (strain CRL 75-36-700-3 / race SCCL) TaxID=418459 RepID=E3KZC0_PUCGT|nr:uncharacterized protein PGTG_15608 [Puccinia graminis f. sp. tritici CRL 75-36-700-3]EFP89645.1 hypothetical protein PGTG_15608 [Puccinia graminis f. sp. tritici CRL 75-36-700-3]
MLLNIKSIVDNGKKEDFGGDKERSIGNTKDTIEVAKYLIGETKDSIGETKDSIGEPKDSIGEKKDSIAETKDLIRERERKFLAEHFGKLLNQEPKMSNTGEQNTEQSVIYQQQKAEMSELKDSMKHMQDMMMTLINQAKAPQNVPVPETPPPRGPSLRFATSTPYTGIAGAETTIGAGEESLLGLAVTSSEEKVELFIKRVEKIASLHKAGGQDVALQLPFMVKSKKISECIENMEGHENRDWDLLKKEMIRKWGRATPLRRFNEDSVSILVSKT